MTKKDFHKKYNDKYIKCYTYEELKDLIDTYADNYNIGWDNNLKDLNFVEDNTYNKIGIIIKFEYNNCYYGYYDDDVKEFIDFKDLFKIETKNTKIKMNEITEILEKIYSNKELRKTIVPLFMSDPGMGKTAMINKFAESKGVKMIEMIASQMSPFEVSGISIPSHTKERMVYYDFDRLADLKDDDIIFLDELPNANPSVLNAMLTLIESRTMVSGRKLPQIMIVAAGNPQGQTPMTPAIKERFVYYDIKFKSRPWIEFMIDKYGITKTIGEKLSKLIIDEKYVGQNFNSPRSVDKAVNMIINEVPTPYEKIIRPILEELVVNTTENDIVLKDNSIFLQNESKKWLDIIKIEKQIK